jgi:TatD DNase family protein
MPEEGIAMLRRALEREPYAAVGEIGLDRWVEGHCMELQIALFVEQWRLGCAYGRPITVHCLRAWGMLLDILQAEQRAPHGFLLHAYGGPVEMVPAFVALGASFSFSTAFIGPERAAKQAPFRAVPLERLLIETDAPDMAPPQSGLGPGAAGILGRDWPAEVNHPRTLVYSFRGIAALRELEEEPCAEQLARNYQALFG